MVTVMKHRVVPSGVFCTATGDRELRTEIRNPLVKPVSDGAGRDASLSTVGARGVFALREILNTNMFAQKKKKPSLVTDAGEVEEREESSEKRGTLVREAKDQKGTIGAQVKRTHNAFTHYPKDPDCNVCNMKSKHSTYKRKATKRVDGIEPFEIICGCNRCVGGRPWRKEILPVKETMTKKGIIGAKSREKHNVFTHYPKHLDCEVCNMTKIIWARCKVKPGKNAGGIVFVTQFLLT